MLEENDLASPAGCLGLQNKPTTRRLTLHHLLKGFKCRVFFNIDRYYDSTLLLKEFFVLRPIISSNNICTISTRPTKISTTWNETLIYCVMRVEIRVDDFDTILSILWLGEVSEVKEITVPNFTFYNEPFNTSTVSDRLYCLFPCRQYIQARKTG